MNTITTASTDYSEQDIERFIAKVSVPDDISECWEWTGAKHSKDRGYGKFRLDGRVQNAHKAAYLLFRGPIQDGMVLGHQCNNERCVNPYHLHQETQSENIKYCVRCGRHGSQQY